MEYVLKQKEIENFYVCLSAYLNIYGLEVYEAGLYQKHGKAYCQVNLFTNANKKKATQAYYRYCSKAREEIKI